MIKNLQARVRILSEALPYIQRFRGHVIVIKYGGSAMEDDVLKHSFARDVVLLKAVGMHPVVVHGGGPHISENLHKAGIEPRFVGGLRVTDDATMCIVEQTLTEVNRDIAAAIAGHGGDVENLPGGVVIARKTAAADGGAKPDLGWVGEVAGIATGFGERATHDTRIPVVAPVGVGDDGHSYNVNADLAASGIAAQLEAEKLILLTNTAGLLDADGTLVVETTRAEVARLIGEGIIHGGMLPKVSCAFDSVCNGVHSAHIIDGRVEHALLLELLTDEGVGTLIHSNSL